MARECGEGDNPIPVVGGTAARALRSETYPAVGDQVAQARRMVAREVTDHPQCDDAVLLVSELVTNVVRHSGAQRFTVSIGETVDGGLVIVVSDNGCAATTPHLRIAQPDHVDGRGMRLVDQLAQRWGTVRDRSAGVSVWLVLGRRPTDSGRPQQFADLMMDEQPCLV